MTQAPSLSSTEFKHDYFFSCFDHGHEFCLSSMWPCCIPCSTGQMWANLGLFGGPARFFVGCICWTPALAIERFCLKKQKGLKEPCWKALAMGCCFWPCNFCQLVNEMKSDDNFQGPFNFDNTFKPVKAEMER